MRPLGAGFRRASEAACGLPSLIRQSAWNCLSILRLLITVAVVETMLSEPENVSASFCLRDLSPEKENARESPEACTK